MKELLNVYVTNLGKYNEGHLIGKWIKLPLNDFDEEFPEILKEIGIDGKYYEEYFITDFESEIGLTCGEYDSIKELNDKLEELQDLTEYELEIIEALVDSGYYDLENAIELKDNVMVYPDCYSMEDVARYYLDETDALERIPDDLRDFFDYEAYGRYLDMIGTFIPYDGNYYEVY